MYICIQEIFFNLLKCYIGKSQKKIDCFENFTKLLFLNIIFIYFRHIPKAKHTTVAETPELRRLAENTKLQSNVS